MDIKIIKLPSESWEDYKNLKLEALNKEPTAFSSSYEESAQYSDDYWQKKLVNIIFAEIDGELVGMLGIVKNSHQKRKHAVSIVSVYVKEKFRGQGIAKKLMEAALEEIKKDSNVIKVDLDVNTEAKVAVKLYQSFGFQIAGTWQKELKIDGQYYDLYEMEKFLDE